MRRRALPPHAYPVLLADLQIADALFVSRRTITSHTSSLLAKLRLPSRTAVIAYAIRHELV
jgi:DNA-binding NarL/FixJ family response regulator